jgi:DNA repair protein RadC
MSDLPLIDLFETLRDWAFRNCSGMEAECARMRTIVPAAAGEQAHCRAISGYFALRDDTAQTRRVLRTLCRQIETSAHPGENVGAVEAASADAGRCVAEDAFPGGKAATGAPEKLSPAQKALLFRVCEWADQQASRRKGKPSGGREPLGESPLRLVRSLREAVPRLGDEATYRIIEALGHDMVVPSPGQHRVLFRLGQLPQSPEKAGSSVREGAARRMATLELLAHWSALTGEPVRVVGHLLQRFSGDPMAGDGDMGAGQQAGVCRARPDCAHCPLTLFCGYYRYRGQEQPAPERKSIKDWREEERPRERLAGRGAETLSDAELLAIIFRTGQSSRSAVDMARDVLEKFGGLGKLDQASLRELQTFPGIGLAKAVEIKAALELGKRLFTPGTAAGKRFTRSREVFEALKSKVISEKREHFFLLALNAKNEILRLIPISTGNLTQSLVHPREVFREAIREAAAAVILVHNHPSGDPAPSQDDRLITSRLCRAGQLLGISVLDHLIIGNDDYFSFADHDMMNDKSTGGDG